MVATTDPTASRIVITYMYGEIERSSSSGGKPVSFAADSKTSAIFSRVSLEEIASVGSTAH